MACSDCDAINRRRFLRTAALSGAALATGSVRADYGKPSETVVAHLYKTLSAEQKRKVVFPFDHPLRSKVDNNWHVTPMKIGEFFNPEQQAMIHEIFRGLHNPEFVDKVLYHVQEDAGGLENYSVALFGEPGSGAFEFVVTGRHCTSRCDGDSVEGAAFGGPIFYGHASQGFNEKPDHPKNVYWYQAKQANEVFQALDGKQRDIALLGDPREEQGSATVSLKSSGPAACGFTGLRDDAGSARTG